LIPSMKRSSIVFVGITVSSFEMNRRSARGSQDFSLIVPCAGSALSEAYRPVCQVHLDFEPACKSPQDEEELSGLPLVNVVRSAVCGDIEHFDGWCRVLLIEMLHGVSPPAVDANEIA
jgi:hypothetical protein